MKKFILTGLVILIQNTYADNTLDKNHHINKEHSSSPFKSHSVEIVPMNQMNLPQELKNKIIKRDEELNKKGYIETEDRYAKFLLNIKKHSNDEIRSYHGTQDIYDTHLKRHPKEIKLAFDFKKLPIEEKNIIGYAAIGGFVKSPKEGWTGIKTFFEDINIGICAYEFFDLNLSHGGMRLMKEGLKYDVNNKPTSIIVEGKENIGFIYSVVWNEGLKSHRIDCATKEYKKDIIGKVLELSKKIDKS